MNTLRSAEVRLSCSLPNIDAGFLVIEEYKLMRSFTANARVRRRRQRSVAIHLDGDHVRTQRDALK